LYFGIVSVVVETALRSASDWAYAAAAGRESAIAVIACVHTRLLRLDITKDSVRYGSETTGREG
jgi:hypothetical protein